MIQWFDEKPFYLVELIMTKSFFYIK